jgi:hypothetical protein
MMSLLPHVNSLEKVKSGAERAGRTLSLLLLVLVGGCSILDFDSCLYELRATEASGQLLEGTSEVLYARVNIGEQRDHQPDKSMLWELRGTPLQGHVTSAVFRDAADESKTLFTFPLTGGGISSGYVTETGGANLNGFFEVVAAGRGVVNVRTDIAGRESLRVTLAKTFQNDWYRPKCG